MKKLLLALSFALFVVNCGADGTKPSDLRGSAYESETGTANVEVQITDASASQTVTINETNPYIGITVTGINSVKNATQNADGTYSDVGFTATQNPVGFTITNTTVTSVIVSCSYKKTVLSTVTNATDNTIRIVVSPNVTGTIDDTGNTTINNAAFVAGKNYIAEVGDSTTYTTSSPHTKGTISTEGQIDLSTIGSVTVDANNSYRIWIF